MSAAAAEFAARASRGVFELQKCADCGAYSWPPRDICASCWSDRLVWAPASPHGMVIATTTLHASLEDFFKSRLPWRIGTVRLDAGPVAFAHLHPSVRDGDRVLLVARTDFANRGVLIARAASCVENDRACEIEDLVAVKLGDTHEHS